MPRYKLRTLLLLLAVVPPLLAVSWWAYSAWRTEQERQRALREKSLEINVVLTTPAPSQPIPPILDPPGVPLETEVPLVRPPVPEEPAKSP